MLSRVIVYSITLALACSLAHATTYTFTDFDGDHRWNNENNWEDENFNPGIPDWHDTAIIPAGKTCEINAGSAGGEADDLTVNGTLSVNKHLQVWSDLTVGGTVTINADTWVRYTLIVNSGATVASHEELIVKELEVYGSLELWPNTDEGVSLELGFNLVSTTHILDGAIYFEDDDPNDAHYPTMVCKFGATLKIRPSSGEEDGLITASAGDNCEPGIVRVC